VPINFDRTQSLTILINQPNQVPYQVNLSMNRQNNYSLVGWLCMICMLISSMRAQEIMLPNDYLDKQFHKERRQALREMMPPNSVAVFFANPVRNRANDVDYIYHQDPDFYYLTGYTEPHSILLVFSEMQEGENGNIYDEMIFVQRRDERAEMWTGRRLGVAGVKEKLGFEVVYEGADFQNEVDFESFDRVLFYDFEGDVRDNERDDADLYSLMETFKSKVAFPDDYHPTRERLYAMIRTTDVENKANVAQIIDRFVRYNTELNQDEILNDFVKADNEVKLREVQEKVPDSKLDTYSLNGYMSVLRETKLPAEMKLLKKAIEISAIGQIEVMKAMRPGMSETEIQGIHEFVFKKYGSEYEGYPSIVGAGHNGCVLHYISNNKPEIEEDELVLMDLGAEYHGYTADVTRTIPANGTFSPEQKAIYDLVYEAQQAGFEACMPGSDFRAPHMAAKEVIDRGLAELGIIQEGQNHRYFPHGTSHYLGLDVHDKGTYGPLQPNTVITVEPGIYIPENSDCDEKWWGIAVRIEDDILITEDGWVNLSEMAPRKSEDIEAMMAQDSPLDDFVLPDLDGE